MRTRVILIFCVTIGLAASRDVRAQGQDGWLRGEGHFDAAVTFAYEQFDEFWIGDRKVSDPGVGTIRRSSWNLWMAYGVTDDLDISAALSYVTSDSSGMAPSNDDFQDLILSAKWRFLYERVGPGRFALLASPGFKVPLGNYEDDFLTAIGDGQSDLRLRVVMQYEFDAGFWVSLETGFDVRFEDTPNEVPIHVRIGAEVVDGLTLGAFYSNVNSVGGYDIGEGPFPGLEEDYQRVGAQLAVRLGDTLTLGATVWTTLDGKNTGDSHGFSLGAVLRF